MKRPLLLLILLFFTASDFLVAQTYDQLTTLGGLTSGSYLIVGDGNTNDGLMRNSTASSVYIDYDAISNPGTSISSGYTANNIFEITVTGSEITIYNSSVGYVSWGRSGATANDADFYNGAVANTERWTPSVSGGLWTLSNVSTSSRILQWNNSSPRFVAYTSNQVKLKLYKLAAAVSYTVTFNANGGTGTMPPQTESSATLLNSNAFSRSGFTFAGWTTSSDSSGTFYADGATFPFSADGDLYAQWTANGSSTSCIAEQDFDANSTWTYTPSPSENSASCVSNGDVWNVVSSLGNITIPNTTGNFWGVQDLNGASGCGTAGVGTLDFGTIDVSAYTNVAISFDYEVDGFNASADEFSYIVTIDGSASSEVFLCDGCDQQNLEGTETISIPNGAANVSLQIRYQVDGGSDYSGVDNFAICGNAATIAPEIEVQGNSTEIINGDTSPEVGDDTDFGDVLVASGSNPNTFTIQNTGGGDLEITSVVSSNPTEFALSGTTSGTISAGTSATFTVTFSTSATGIRTSTITIESDDADEGTYTFEVVGNGTAPCATPAAQATNLILDNITSSSIDVSFTAASPGADNYLVVQSTTPALSSNPVDDVVYIVGDGLGGGTVVFNSSGTSFTASGLAYGTTYYYFVFAYNDAACTGSDTKYNTPALSNQATTLTETCIGVESFESGNLPGSWFATNAYVNSDPSGADANTGISYLFLQTVGSNVNLEPVDNPISLTFYARQSFLTLPSPMIVGYDSLGTFIQLASLAVSSESYEEYTIDLASINELTGISLFIISTENVQVFVDDVSVLCGLKNPEIAVRGNSTDITNGDASPSLLDYTDFGSTDGSISRTFTIVNSGGDDLTLTDPNPYISITGTNASDFTVTANPSSLINASGSSAFTITFSPSAIGTRQASISIANNDGDENPFTFDIEGFGESSSESDIVETASAFVYEENIDYTAYQGNPITNTSNSLGVFKFDIRDGGATGNDADALATELSAITFDVVNNDNVRNAALFDGNSKLADGVVSGSTISFAGLSGLDYTAPDNDVKALTLRVSFETTVTDNDQLQFIVASATASSSGSVFASLNAGGAFSSLAGDDNRLEVTASTLAFVDQPNTTSTNVAMAPAVTVEAVDGNGNRDLDFASDVQVSSTGTLTGSPVSSTASNGLVTFPSLVHTIDGTGFNLIAQRTGSLDWDVTSAAFDIILFVFEAGDFRPQFATDFSFNGTWEFFDGFAWLTAAGGGWDGLAPQNTLSIINRIIIDEYVSGGGNSDNNYDCDIIIQNGGTLELSDNDNPPVVTEFLSAGNTLEVEQGGELIISGDIDVASTTNITVRDGATMVINQNSITNDHPMWDGIEKFEGGSSFVINDWNWSASATTRSLINVVTAISDNDNGYKFGEIIFDANPTADWTLVGGSVNVNLAENDVFISNESANNVQIMTNRTSGISTTFGGDLYVLDGDFSFSGTYNSDDFNHTINILGDFENLSDGEFYLHRNNLNTPNSINSSVNIKGDVTVDGPTVFSSNQASSNSSYELHFNGDGSATQLLNAKPNVSNVHFILDPNSSVALSTHPLNFTGNAHFEVESGATFNFGFDNLNNPLYISQLSGGGNQWSHRTGAYTFITDPAGLDESNNSDGNVRNIPSSNRSTGQTGSTFHYIGKTNQESGDFHTAGSTDKIIIVELDNNLNTLTLTNTTGTSNLLDIKRGIFVESEAAHISGSGNLTITDGGFRTSVLSGTGTVPQLTGTYGLTGGFVELGAFGDQSLRGSRDYYDLIISGSNTLGADDKTPTSAFTVASLLTITGTPIFDISNQGMTGDAGITMDGGLLRISKLSTTTPELTGVNNPYNLTDGTVEWYGTGNTQNQNIRGTYGASSTTVSYHHIEVNADAANTNEFNVGLEAGIELTGVMNVNSPAVFQMDESDHIDGIGVFNVLSGSTYKYGDEFGITLGTSTAISAGALRMSSPRIPGNFSSNASYGFVGNGNMLTGDALPTEMLNMYVQKSTSGNTVTMVNDAEVSNTLDFLGNGVLQTGSNLLYVSNDANTAILSANTSGTDKYIQGNLQWNTDGASSYTFPIGHSTQGAQGFTINVTGSSGSDILSFLESNISAPILNYAYCDLETPNGGSGEIGTGVGTPDGVLDQITFNLSSPLQWNITNPGGGISSYDLEVLANGGQDINPVVSTSGTEIRFLMKNGEPGNTGVATTNGAPAFNLTGFDYCPNQYTLNGMTSFSSFTLNGSSPASTSLPVELLYFNAEVWNKKEVKCAWATATEINNDFFTVERSVDGENFETVGIVQGAGSYNGTLNYEFFDKSSLSGLSYYRLRQTDFDGSFEFSSIVPLQLNKDEHQFKVYPQPFESDLLISSKGDVQVQYVLYDISAKHLVSGVFVGELNLNLSQLTAGSYFMQLSSNEGTETIKVLKK